MRIYRNGHAEFTKNASSAQANRAHKKGYLKSWREPLRKDGHVIFKGMFENTGESQENMYGGERFKDKLIVETSALFLHFHKLVPRLKGKTTEVNLPDHKCIWDIIRDTAMLGDGEMKCNSRLSSKCEATNEDLEDNAQELLAVRCSLEIVFMIICCMFNLRHAHLDTDDSHSTKEIYAPDTGSRFLASMPLTTAQRAITKDGVFQALLKNATPMALYTQIVAAITRNECMSNEYVAGNEEEALNAKKEKEETQTPAILHCIRG